MPSFGPATARVLTALALLVAAQLEREPEGRDSAAALLGAVMLTGSVDGGVAKLGLALSSLCSAGPWRLASCSWPAPGSTLRRRGEHQRDGLADGGEAMMVRTCSAPNLDPMEVPHGAV